MALDPVEQAAINRINSLFASVTVEAGNAASNLGNVATAASNASGGLGGFVSSLGSAGSGVASSTHRMSSSMDSAATGFTASAGILAGATDNILGKISGILSGGEANFSDAGQLAKGMLGGVAAGGDKAGKAFAGLAKPMAVVGKVAGVLGTAMGAAANYNNDLLQNWRGLTRSGISLQGAIENVGIAQGEANLSLTQMGKHLTTNSEAFAVLGGSASGGAEAFLRLQSTLQSVDVGYGNSARSFRESLETLGITSDESAGLISDMLGSQMMAAKFRNLDEKAQAETTADYIMNLDQLSKLTGKSREQLAQEQKQMANDTQFQAAMSGKTAEEMQAMQSAMQRIQEVGGPAAVEAFKARLAGVVPAGKEARMLLATPMGRVVEDMAGEMAGATDASGIGKIAANYENALGEGAKQSRDMLLPLAKAGGLVAGEFSSLFGVMNKTVIRNQGLIDEQEKLTGTVTSLDQAMQSMLETVSGTKRDDTGAITQVGSDLTNTVTEVTTSLQEIVNWVQVQSAELSADYIPTALRGVMDAWNGVMSLGEDVGDFFGQSWTLPKSAFSRDVTSVGGTPTAPAFGGMDAEKNAAVAERDYQRVELSNAAYNELGNTLMKLSAEELLNAEQLQQMQQQFVEKEIEAGKKLGLTVAEAHTASSTQFDNLVKLFQEQHYKRVTGASDEEIAAMTQGGPLSHQNVDIGGMLANSLDDAREKEELANRKLWVGSSNKDLASLIAESNNASTDRLIEYLKSTKNGSTIGKDSNIQDSEYGKQTGTIG